MKITEENKLKGSLFIEAYGSLIDGISKDAESETEKALDITFNAIGAASATVMLAVDPLGTLIGAGIGWLIEHVSFLRDALNQVMGDPDEIKANVDANKAKAVELRQLAEDHKSGLATFDGWTGASSERFKASMDGMTQELEDLANAVESKAKIVAIMGMLVTVLRDIVRDMIAQLLGSLIGGAIAAAAAMIPTFGASIPIFIGFAVGKAVALGVNIASRVARVVAALGRQMKRIGDLDDIMAKISKGWNRFENGADVAEIAYEGYKAQNEVNKAVDKVTPGGGSGGSGGSGGEGTSGTKTAADTLAKAREGTVQASQMHALQAPTARVQAEGEPMQALSATRMHDAPVQMAQAQPQHLVMPLEAEAVRPAHRLEPMEALQPMHRAEPAEALRPTHRVEAAEALRPMHRVEPVEQLQPMYRSEAPQAMQRVDAMPAQDATMASGVSMTAATPFQQAVQPHEFSNSAFESTPAEPLQGAQASHVFQALEPTQSYERAQPVQSYAAFEAPAEEGYNPLLAQEAPRGGAAHETAAQAGGAPAQPLRQAVTNERPRQPGQ
ncbi:hypothetical protein [Lentzea terrae]|uniref:hypothetical protein n=1 Tax=Lentzea terrae TaxID=2200761 RepID=UPI0018E53117|nr:hypothetical protein [Lentzea terrae]